MSVEAVTWALNHSKSKGNARMVLFCLADRANADDFSCFPSVKNLARQANISDREAQRCLGELVKSKEVRVEQRRRPNGSLTSNLYILACHHPGDQAVTTPGDHTYTTLVTALSPPEPKTLNLVLEPSGEPSQEGATFEKFWKAYPNRRSKKQAWKAWRTMTPEDRRLAIAGIWKVCGVEERYIPHASTYLNARRWEDEPALAAAPPTSLATAGQGPVAVQSPPCWKCGRPKVWHALKPQNRKRDVPDDDGHEYAK